MVNQLLVIFKKFSILLVQMETRLMKNRNRLLVLLLGAVFFALLFLNGCSSEQKEQAKAKPYTVPTPAPVAVEDSSATARKITQLESDLIEAYKHGDTITLGRLIHDYYSVGLPTGDGFGNKISEIAGAKKLITPGYVLENDTMQVMVYQDVAIVTKLLRQETIVKGRKQVFQSLWTDT